MSYSFSATMIAPEAVAEKIAADEMFQRYAPDGIKQALSAMIETYAGDGATSLDVACYGHCPTPGETCVGATGQAHLNVVVLEAKPGD